MIQEITEFIEGKAGLTRDTDIFAGHRSVDATSNCDVVIDSGGGTAFFDLPERVDIVIQVLSRGDTYLTARKRAYVIYDAIFRNLIFGSAGWILPIVTVGEEYEAMVIEPLAPPQYIGQDEKLRFEFSTNFIFRVKKL